MHADCAHHRRLETPSQRGGPHLTTLDSRLRALGHLVKVIQPGLFTTAPCPAMPRSGWRSGRMARCGDCSMPSSPSTSTLPPKAPRLAARRYCAARSLQFTTSFHTRFPEYVNTRFPFLPVGPGYALLRRFHAGASRTLVSNPELIEELRERGFANLVLWRRGVDTGCFGRWTRPFCPAPADFPLHGSGRTGKNLEDFLRLDLPGTKYVVGEGPARAELEARYPGVRFAGLQTGEALVRHLSSADCFVFPSRTDTLGLVMMEALACGVPVAAYPVIGPTAVVRSGETGWLDEDLGQAALKCLDLDPAACRASALGWSLDRSCAEFLSYLVPARVPLPFTLFEGLPLRGSAMKVLVLGGDGFCGWPTALHLSARGMDVALLDNFSRRRIDRQIGSASLTPITSMEERLATWQTLRGRALDFTELDLAQDYESLCTLLTHLAPDAIVHFAEQRSAPYSMRSPATKRYTVQNNLAATHNLLCALVEIGLDAHVVHLGTMGYTAMAAPTRPSRGLPAGSREQCGRAMGRPRDPASRRSGQRLSHDQGSGSAALRLL